MYRWTEGDGCNIEPDLELSQFDIGEIKINTTTTDINKGKQIFSDIVWNTRIIRYQFNVKSLILNTIFEIIFAETTISLLFIQRNFKATLQKLITVLRNNAHLTRQFFAHSFWLIQKTISTIESNNE